MKLRSAAVGIAALGAGWMVARMLRRRGGAESASASADQAPPNPEQLIGYPASHKDAAASAEVFRESRRRPV